MKKTLNFITSLAVLAGISIIAVGAVAPIVVTKGVYALGCCLIMIGAGASAS